MSIICRSGQDLGYLNEGFQYFGRHHGEKMLGMQNLENYFSCVSPGLGSQNFIIQLKIMVLYLISWQLFLAKEKKI